MATNCTGNDVFLVSVLAGELFAANSVFRVSACTNANKRCICVSIRYHRTHYEQLPPCNSRLQTAVTQRFGLYTLGLTSPHSRNVSTTNPRAFLLASSYPLLPIFFFPPFRDSRHEPIAFGFRRISRWRFRMSGTVARRDTVIWS